MKKLFLLFSFLLAFASAWAQTYSSQVVTDTSWMAWDTAYDAFYEYHYVLLENGSVPINSKVIVGDTTAALSKAFNDPVNEYQAWGASAVYYLTKFRSVRDLEVSYAAFYDAIADETLIQAQGKFFFEPLQGQYRIRIDGTIYGTFTMIQLGNGTVRLVNDPDNITSFHIVRPKSENTMMVVSLPTYGNVTVHKLGLNGSGREVWSDIDGKVIIVRL
jgi:hypothetical protein